MELEPIVEFEVDDVSLEENEADKSLDYCTYDTKFWLDWLCKNWVDEKLHLNCVGTKI